MADLQERCQQLLASLRVGFEKPPSTPSGDSELHQAAVDFQSTVKALLASGQHQGWADILSASAEVADRIVLLNEGFQAPAHDVEPSYGGGDEQAPLGRAMVIAAACIVAEAFALILKSYVGLLDAALAQRLAAAAAIALDLGQPRPALQWLPPQGLAGFTLMAMLRVISLLQKEPLPDLPGIDRRAAEESGMPPDIADILSQELAAARLAPRPGPEALHSLATRPGAPSSFLHSADITQQAPADQFWQPIQRSIADIAHPQILGKDTEAEAEADEGLADEGLVAALMEGVVGWHLQLLEAPELGSKDWWPNPFAASKLEVMLLSRSQRSRELMLEEMETAGEEGRGLRVRGALLVSRAAAALDALHHQWHARHHQEHPEGSTQLAVAVAYLAKQVLHFVEVLPCRLLPQEEAGSPAARAVPSLFAGLSAAISALQDLLQEGAVSVCPGSLLAFAGEGPQTLQSISIVTRDVLLCLGTEASRLVQLIGNGDLGWVPASAAEACACAGALLHLASLLEQPEGEGIAHMWPTPKLRRVLAEAGISCLRAVRQGTGASLSPDAVLHFPPPAAHAALAPVMHAAASAARWVHAVHAMPSEASVEMFGGGEVAMAACSTTLTTAAHATWGLFEVSAQGEPTLPDEQRQAEELIGTLASASRALLQQAQRAFRAPAGSEGRGGAEGGDPSLPFRRALALSTACELAAMSLHPCHTLVRLPGAEARVVSSGGAEVVMSALRLTLISDVREEGAGPRAWFLTTLADSVLEAPRVAAYVAASGVLRSVAKWITFQLHHAGWRASMGEEQAEKLACRYLNLVHHTAVGLARGAMAAPGQQQQEQLQAHPGETQPLADSQAAGPGAPKPLIGLAEVVQGLRMLNAVAGEVELPVMATDPAYWRGMQGASGLLPAMHSLAGALIGVWEGREE